MALYSSNKQYKCEACGKGVFKEEETFLIDEHRDSTKLSSPVVLKKTITMKKIICANCNRQITQVVE